MFSSKGNRNNVYCSKCKGSCIRKTSSETQAAAMKMFGIIPNACVPNLKGINRCPYKKK